MIHRNLALLFIVMSVLVAFASAQSSQIDGAVMTARTNSSHTGGATVQLQYRDQRYRLRKSDVIEVKFKFSPEFDETVTVQPDGFITLSGAGDIKVENKTLPELREAIEQGYQGILHEPIITVSLKDFDKPFFIAAGQVAHPGKYELRSDTTLVAALAMAGDFLATSKHSQVVLFRHVSGEMVEAKVFNVKRMLGSRKLEEDPHLSPGDIVFVPQNKISKIRPYLPTASMGTYVSPTQF
jgi:polysaccharide export outer membrane protein